jgi:ferritin-like metal-binding protein YciE
MPEVNERDAKLIELLNEAYNKERHVEGALESHLGATTREDYEKRLRDHLKETKSHASSVERRIKQLGGTAEAISVPGSEGVARAAQTVQGVVHRARAASQGPLHGIRSSGEQEKMLRNARDEYQDESEEIATYTVIDALATSVGDKQTAKLARDIRRQEERMALYLADLLPELATNVAHDSIPVSQIEGDASRRTTRDAKTPARGASSAKAESPRGAKKGATGSSASKSRASSTKRSSAAKSSSRGSSSSRGRASSSSSSKGRASSAKRSSAGTTSAKRSSRGTARSAASTAKSAAKTASSAAKTASSAARSSSSGSKSSSKRGSPKRASGTKRASGAKRKS